MILPTFMRTRDSLSLRGVTYRIGTATNLFFDILWCCWFMFLYMFLSAAVFFGLSLVSSFTGFEIGTYLSSIIFDVLVAYMLFFRFPHFCYEERSRWSNVRLALLLVVLVPVCWLVSSVVSTLIYQAGDTVFVATYEATELSEPSWLLMIFALLIAPISEEIIFRGCIYGGLRRRYNVLVAGIVSSVFFALAHGTMVHLPLTFLLGLVCAFAYERTDNIGASMLVHSFTNTLSMFVSGFVALPLFMYEPIIIGPLYALCAVTVLAISYVCQHICPNKKRPPLVISYDPMPTPLSVKAAYDGVEVPDDIVVENVSGGDEM